MKSMNMNRMLGSLKRKRKFWTLHLRIDGRAADNLNLQRTPMATKHPANLRSTRPRQMLRGMWYVDFGGRKYTVRETC
jgi:hypothetical protein